MRLDSAEPSQLYGIYCIGAARGSARTQEGGPVYAHYQRLDSEEVLELRREGGRYLKELREAQGLSQRQLAALVGAEYYTFISQLETGRGRIPPDRYRAWAEALAIEPSEFVRNVMRFYDPITYEILFGDRTPRAKNDEAEGKRRS